MRILKAGIKLVKWEKELECTGEGNGKEYQACGALLLVEEDDIYQTQYKEIGGYGETCVTFACAQCGTETDVDKKTVPRHIQEKLLKKEDWTVKRRAHEEYESRKRCRIESNDK